MGLRAATLPPGASSLRDRRGASIMQPMVMRTPYDTRFYRVCGLLLAALASLAPMSQFAAAQEAGRPGRPDQSGAATPKSQRRLPRGFLARALKMPDGKSRKYAIFIPPQYNDDVNHRWPVILFLHGSGEIGADGIRQTTVGMPVYVARLAARFPFIVVMPQAHKMWFRGEEATAVSLIMEEVHHDYRTDRDRVYLTGLSMGGFATWEMSIFRPDLFAAIVPVCGIAPLQYIKNIVHIPVWAFHGSLDKNVPVSGSRDAVAELKRLGASPKYTEYPNLGHKCWDLAYDNPELYRWMLQFRRPPPPRVIDYSFPAGIVRVWWLVVEGEKKPKRPPHVRAEIRDDGRVEIVSEGVIGWALISDAEPLPPGREIDVTWNGKPVFKGKFEGILALEPPRPSGASTQPSPGR
ncbi:MAG: hypothetical protein DCC65_08685 [Planctomycetota bacterium]|nr:MAG: hypothetical protein DCC65_08685 [Planctomycetota bacterium]